jgi:hemoglobin
MEFPTLVEQLKQHPLPDQSSLYDRLGGRPTLERVHKAFYTKIFSHPDFAALFDGLRIDHQVSQQTAFMMGLFGGPKIFGGRPPKGAHQHLFITEEQFELRHKILGDTLSACGIRGELRERWLYYDYSFKSQIVKSSIEQCEKRYTNDRIRFVPRFVQ